MTRKSFFGGGFVELVCLWLVLVMPLGSFGLALPGRNEAFCECRCWVEMWGSNRRSDWSTMGKFLTTKVANDTKGFGWSWVTFWAVVTLRSVLLVGEWWVELWGIQSAERLVDYGGVFDHEKRERREGCGWLPVC